MKKGKQRATGSDHDASSEDGILLIKKADKGAYSLAVRGDFDCYYTIDFAPSSDKSYSIIEQGLYSDVKIEKD